jgi:hypothetical protein
MDLFACSVIASVVNGLWDKILADKLQGLEV